MLTTVIFALANGMTTAMAVFLVASGVTLIFGLLKILNFAHGAFFMIGAYVAFTLVGQSISSVGVLIGVSAVAAGAVAILGYVADVLVLRRLRDLDEATTLIATFALLLICDGAVKLIWGVGFHSISPPESLVGMFEIGPVLLPKLSVFVILFGVATYAVLDLAIHRLWFGKIVQCIAKDRWMSGVIGINVPAVFVGTVIGAFALAGLAGGILLSNQSLSPSLSHSYLIPAFVVVIIGGLGNVRGAFLASIILGTIESFNLLLLPTVPGLAIYVAMVGFLLWRPQGLLSRGGEGEAAAHNVVVEPAARITLSRGTAGGLAALAALACFSLPLWLNQGIVFLAGIALIEALFAISWNLLFGLSGMVSFGHAAFFAIGGYVMSFGLVRGAPTHFLPLLVGSFAIGGLAAGAIGAVAIRRSVGVALAILTLAICEVLKTLIGYSSALGRDDGLSGIPRPVLDLGFFQIGLQSHNAYFWFICVVVSLCVAALWWVASSRFGRALKAIRQDFERAEFLGINVAARRLAIFSLSGGVAALAGALLAPWTQIVTPESASYLHSAAPMLSALLGGVDYFFGPALGAIIFAVLAYLTRSLVGLSDLVSGLVLLLIVLVAPQGLLGLGARTVFSKPLGLRPAPVKG